MYFYPVIVKEIRRETSSCVSITLEPQNNVAFTYKQGQYLTLRTHIEGEEVRRSYSICSAPYESGLRVAIKQVEGGLFSTFANTQLKVGDVLEAMLPEGRFFVEMEPSAKRLFVAFAAGSGITPIISIIKAMIHEEPHSRMVLFYGNQGFDHIIFRDELELLKNSHPDRIAFHHIFSRESMTNELFQGHINADKCNKFARFFFDPKDVDQYFLCGPSEMIFAVKDSLTALGVESTKIKFELFTAGKKTNLKPVTKSDKMPSLDAQITVIQDGIEFNFRLPSEGSTLLDAAMRAGADLPFSCKGGVCSTCKAKVLEGEVEMELNYGLEPDEVAAGYVLTCQAHPKTDRVVVTFDEA
jgi:ring-1,2-phenylacetyl-CoA epoxidase subunit PaaE